MQVLISSFALYLGKALLLSGVLYAYFHFFLRDKQTFGWNRTYLLGAAILTVVVPFVHIPVPLPFETQAHQHVLLLDVSQGSVESALRESGPPAATRTPFPWESLVLGAYAAVVLLMLGGFLLRVRALRRLRRQAVSTRMERVTLLQTDAPGTPFSFFNWIFWDRQLPVDSEAGRKIFRHELAHIRYRHSLDKMGLELLCIFLFPVFPLYLIRRELRLVHEYQADHEAAGRKDVDAYAEYLIQHALGTKGHALGTKGHALAHAFHAHPLARRILMLERLPRLKGGKWSRWMVLPLFLGGTALCAFRMERPLPRTLTVVIDAGHGGEDPGEKDINLAIVREIGRLAPDYPLHIILTRQKDTFQRVQDKVIFCETQHADLFVSIHTNFHESPELGIQAYISDRNRYYDSSVVLGSLLARRLNQVYPTDQVLRKPTSAVRVLDRNVCPAVLLECGDISNPKDAAYMSSASNQEKLARGVLQALSDYAGGRK
jgi:N-acetylmuramoyl-L-alanine amidase